MLKHKKLKGEIKSWNKARGFGFITPADGGKVVFVHISNFKGGKHVPELGAQVSFSLVRDKHNRPCAARVIFTDEQKRSKKVKFKNALIAFVLLFLCSLGISVFMAKLPVLVLVIYSVMSLITFIIYWRDKSAAKLDKWRTKEDTLHLLALFGGWPGAILAQQLIRHKSKKFSFQFIFWLAVVLNLTLFFLLHTEDGGSYLRLLVF